MRPRLVSEVDTDILHGYNPRGYIHKNPWLSLAGRRQYADHLCWRAAYACVCVCLFVCVSGLEKLWGMAGGGDSHLLI